MTFPRWELDHTRVIILIVVPVTPPSPPPHTTLIPSLLSLPALYPIFYSFISPFVVRNITIIPGFLWNLSFLIQENPLLDAETFLYFFAVTSLKKCFLIFRGTYFYAGEGVVQETEGKIPCYKDLVRIPGCKDLVRIPGCKDLVRIPGWRRGMSGKTSGGDQVHQHVTKKALAFCIIVGFTCQQVKGAQF
jgi:hypothetical protein